MPGIKGTRQAEIERDVCGDKEVVSKGAGQPVSQHYTRCQTVLLTAVEHSNL